MVATKYAALLVIRIEKKALTKKIASMAAPTIGKVWAVTAGMVKLANSNMRPGLLPWVRKIAVEVTTNPMARIPRRSNMESIALRPVKKYHFDRSLGVINAKLALTAFSIPQV
jgi:hypothetical protein